jgi:glutamine synthetase
LVPGHEAPVDVSWARHDPSAVARIPSVKGDFTESTRLEYRAPDPAANPYLAFAVMLAAGLDGVRQSRDLVAEGERVGKLPRSLADACDAMDASPLMHETLGSHLVEWFLRNKREEWSAYRREVTPFEWSRYLPLL